MELLEIRARELPRIHIQIELKDADQYDKVFMVKKTSRSGEYVEYFIEKEND